MEVSRIRALRGPNLWSRHTAIEAVVRCTENELAMAQIAGFEARLRALFPQARLKVIAGAGHWLHAEKPAIFLRLARDFLAATS